MERVTMFDNKCHAIVLDLNFAGYGIVRSLTEYDIPVIGFYKDHHIPEARTSLCMRKIQFSDDKELLYYLLNLPETKYEKPVLYFTSDEYVIFFQKNRKQIEEKYKIDLSGDETNNLLLDKNRFSEFARQNNILIPKSMRVNDKTQVPEVETEIRFPAIFKPFLRRPSWIQAKLPKAFYLRSINDFKSAFELSMPYEKNMIIQEWIPGPDSNVCYCLAYYDNKGSCIGAFTGFKIRQWPVGTGSTATAAPSDSSFVANETKRIFNLLNYKGFGSIEFKRHEVDGRFYLMEPTAGRLNQQEYVATLNGVNLPLIAYNQMTKNSIQEVKPIYSPVIYIDELAEFASSLFHLLKRRITIKQWCESLCGHRAYRYYNKNDRRVFFGLFLKVVRKMIIR